MKTNVWATVIVAVMLGCGSGHVVSELTDNIWSGIFFGIFVIGISFIPFVVSKLY